MIIHNIDGAWIKILPKTCICALKDSTIKRKHLKKSCLKKRFFYIFFNFLS